MAGKTTTTGHFVRMSALTRSLLLFMLLLLFASASPSLAQLSEHIRFSGYIQGSPVRIAAEMPGATSDEIWWEYRLQQRLNLAYVSDSGFSMHWQMRTRLFAGDLVRDVPGYAGLIDTDTGLVNASWMVAPARFLVFASHSRSLLCRVGPWRLEHTRRPTARELGCEPHQQPERPV